MKALSVREPWASMIASGQKTIEVRSRRTHYRGALAICASRGGGAVAVVELVDCRPFVEADDAGSGGVWSRFPECRTHFAWTLRLVRRVTSAPIKGRLGFYDVDESQFQPYDSSLVELPGTAGVLDVRRATGDEVPSRVLV